MSVSDSSHKAAVSVSELASLCQLSRSRFHALIKSGVFPAPLRNVSGARPYYTQELIEQCLEIRRTGIGQNGQVVLFNRRKKGSPERKRPAPAQPPAPEHTDLVEAIRALGLATSNEAVGNALQKLYPNGTHGIDQGEVIRKVFLHLQGGKK